MRKRTLSRSNPVNSTRKGLLSVAIASAVFLAGCGDGDTVPGIELPFSDEQAGADLKVSFTTPERLVLIDTGLSAVVTIGGKQLNMDAEGSGFNATLSNLTPGQQYQIYIGVRRNEDGLLLAAGDITAWINDSGTDVSLPEQRFRYNFDQDGDGVYNIVEIERGTSPTDLSLDFDADGVPDDSDQDDDNDGINDLADAFPLNGQEYADNDGDGIGNNTDPDDDGDGVNDDSDAFPLDPDETTDSDLDGVGDNQDQDADGNGIDDNQEDSDNDGVPDPIDLFPNDYHESSDVDGDGIGDNADPDDNNDGVADYREGSQIIVPYVDNASVNIDGIWNHGYDNNVWFDEWSKATNSDSYGYSLAMANLLVDNTGRLDEYAYNSAYFDMMHDGEYLYFKFVIDYEELENWFNDSDEIWHDDSAEIYIDVGNDGLDAYGNDDYQRIFRFRDTAIDPTIDGFYSASGMQSEHMTSYRHENSTDWIYSQLYEIRIKLSSINLKPGDTFGLEVAYNDDDDGGDRETKWGWWAPVGTDEAWFRPMVFGEAKLQPSD